MTDNASSLANLPWGQTLLSKESGLVPDLWATGERMRHGMF